MSVVVLLSGERSSTFFLILFSLISIFCLNFKIKLKIFDDTTTKDIMTREEKSQIRKSTDIVEILGVYYQVREKAGVGDALA